MKKIYLIISLLIISLLTSCNSSTTIVGIDIVYYDNLNEVVDYKGIDSSCALYNNKTKDTYSGVVIEKEDDNYYIISSAYLGEIDDKVIFYSSKFKIDGGLIIGVDSKNGLSLIKLNTNYELDCINIASSITKGESIYSVSTPLGINNDDNSRVNQINKGIISRIDSYYINIDCSLNENSYGCGIYNNVGNLVGIMIDKVYSDTLNSYYVQGMSYAIYTEYLLKSYEDMKKYGDITRPQFGITVMEYHKTIIDIYTSLYPNEGYENLKAPSDDRTYIIIKEVVEDSNAYNILNSGDIILTVNNIDIYHTNDISSIINFSNINDTININILRYDDLASDFIEYTYNIYLLINNQN